jgi:HEAT repeat protein
LSDDDRKLLTSVDRDRIVAALTGIFHRETRYAVGRRRAFQAALAIPSLDRVGFLIDIFNRAPIDWKTAICDELASFHDPRAVRMLCSALLTAKNPNVRYAAAEALALNGDATAIDALAYTAQQDRGKDFEGFPVAEAARDALEQVRSRLREGDTAPAFQ